MRVLILVVLALLGAGPAAAQAPPSAETAVFERRALLAADTRCGLFAPPVRAALEAGAWQARGALLRADWPSARIAALEARAEQSAQARPCSDAETQAAAARARTGFAGWARLAALEFRGGERRWMARRSSDPEGWILVQTIDAPRAAAFGAMRGAGRIEAALSVALAERERAPSSAELVIRDVRRAPESLFEIPGRAASGLAAGAPSLATARRFMARDRRIDADKAGARRLRFVFPDEALSAMALLDPREAAEIRLDNGVRLLVEIGDLAAARAFLNAR
jgi:hypothetical protein